MCRTATHVIPVVRITSSFYQILILHPHGIQQCSHCLLDPLNGTKTIPGHNLLTFGAISGLSLGRRLWLNLGLSNMRAKGLAEVV